MADEYRELIEGEALEIGDEYQSDGEWETLSESEFSEWVTAYSHYWPSKGMSPFRRALNKDPELAIKSQQVLEIAVNGMFGE